MDNAFDEEIYTKFNSALDDNFITHHMEKNKGGTNERKLEKELHEPKVKLHEVKEDVYAVKMMLGKPRHGRAISRCGDRTFPSQPEGGRTHTLSRNSLR
ncbi:hypothetical protein DPV78_001455 [Talaromyces pinophilus]|nr:hypothetical protein DPV78_001455 [Talaromyces pinophilus]